MCVIVAAKILQEKSLHLAQGKRGGAERDASREPRRRVAGAGTTCRDGQKDTFFQPKVHVLPSASSSHFLNASVSAHYKSASETAKIRSLYPTGQNAANLRSAKILYSYNSSQRITSAAPFPAFPLIFCPLVLR